MAIIFHKNSFFWVPGRQQLQWDWRGSIKSSSHREEENQGDALQHIDPVPIHMRISACLLNLDGWSLLTNQNSCSSPPTSCRFGHIKSILVRIPYPRFILLILAQSGHSLTQSMACNYHLRNWQSLNVFTSNKEIIAFNAIS